MLTPMEVNKNDHGLLKKADDCFHTVIFYLLLCELFLLLNRRDMAVCSDYNIAPSKILKPCAASNNAKRFVQ